MRHLLYVIPLLCGLWMWDNSLSLDRYAGWERNSVRNSMVRWERGKRAKVAIFGSSTSKDWLPVTLAAKVTGVRAGDVLDAHVNGCHQGCTWSSVRTLLQRERHYQAVFFATNLFQMCEELHSKRVLQHQMMLPAQDVPRLFGLYAHADQPLTYVGRYVGMTLSGAYGDTAALQRWLREDLFGKPKGGRTHLWARPSLPEAPKKTMSCRYRPEDVAYKAAVSAALLDDLSLLADNVFLLLLPDPTAASDDPEDQRRWVLHRALHQQLADERPAVTLIDLVTDGVVEQKDYRDAIHLHRRAMPRQQTLFEKRMKAVGWPPPRPTRKSAKGKSKGKSKAKAKSARAAKAPSAEAAKAPAPAVKGPSVEGAPSVPDVRPLAAPSVPDGKPTAAPNPAKATPLPAGPAR